MNGRETLNKMIKAYDNIHATYTSKQFLDLIDPKEVNVVIEGGSRDLLDSLFLEQHFTNALIHSFECNEEAYVICSDNLKKSSGRIKLNKLAMTNKNGKMSFYAFDHNLTTQHDIGVSSLYRHKDQNGVPQKEISVMGTRLDTYCTNNNITKIDYLCLDVQGAEQSVLEGLGKMLDTVKYIVLENDSDFYLDAPDISNQLLTNYTVASKICNDSLYIKK